MLKSFYAELFTSKSVRLIMIELEEWNILNSNKKIQTILTPSVNSYITDTTWDFRQKNVQKVWWVSNAEKGPLRGSLKLKPTLV